MKVTLKDIAEKVNVSISTVSRVLNDGPHGVEDAMHLRILQVAEDLGYRRVKKN
ncbi:LacI family transcriptional regulator [Paenibacillus sp. JMULE4]|uniref:LacI family DNA-binding transcriptional regulator n=1 Tax=Paenibacillus sp. JMULE4 TaxID=2518342 RepID=UPI000AD7E9C8|nr:LacI family transcriptional regulator [Paenibacillus sp. JMULE4]